jgi:uncharacterized membrane protein YcjF (UPF0283 family)
MNSTKIQILRVIAGIASVLIVAVDSPLWWIAIIPWAILCILGIIATLPIFLLIGIGAGAAQADWMSDGFIIVVCFVIPTFLAILIAEFLKSRKNKAVQSNRIEIQHNETATKMQNKAQ